MDVQIHAHIDHWLEASVKGRLSRSQRQALRAHLAECPVCQRQACDPVWVEHAETLLARRAAVSPDLEARVTAELREGMADEQASRLRQRRRRTRLGLRIGLAGALLVLLAVRSLNLHCPSRDTWVGRALAATTQVFLREPRYGLASGLPEDVNADEVRLAVAHQMLKGCVGMLLWVCVLLLSGLAALDVWRAAHRLNSSA